MDESIFLLLCICWWSMFGPALCQLNNMCNVFPVDISYSSQISKFTSLNDTLNSQSYWCSNGSLQENWMDLYPYLKADFGNNVTIVGLAIKIAGNSKTYHGFQSFIVYKYSPLWNTYVALTEHHPGNAVIQIFPGITLDDIEKDEAKLYTFPYHITNVTKLKIYFKLKPGHTSVCLKIQFYQDPCLVAENPVGDKNLNVCTPSACQDSSCVQLNSTFYCKCENGSQLWRDGLRCFNDTKSDFLVTQWRKHVTFAQQECHTNARRLLTVATPNNYEDFMTKITKYNRAGSYIIGLVDVDNDQSYSRWIDGSDAIVDLFEEHRNFPGSIGMLTGIKDANIKWGFKNSFEREKYICSSEYKDGFILSGHYDVKDRDFVASSYLANISLASFNAFGPQRSRRGTMSYATISDSNVTYGLYWSPQLPAKHNEYVGIQLAKGFIDVTGVAIQGFSCFMKNVYFVLILRIFLPDSKQITEKMVKDIIASSTSRTIHRINKKTKSNNIMIQFTLAPTCKGYQWDVIGKVIGIDGPNCNSDCEQSCIETPLSFFCVCKEKWHLFADERKCVKESKPNLNGLVRVESSYHIFKNVINTYQRVPIYYDFFPEEMSFTKAIETCRKFGGYLPSFHAIHEHRLLYKHLDKHASCKKWFLGLNGTSLLHSAWHDHSWVDFTLFVDTIPETFDTEQVVYMNTDMSYLWEYDKPASTKACVMCQHRPNDCSKSIIAGPWKMHIHNWEVYSKFPKDKKMLPNIILDLKSGLNYFESKSPDGYVEIVLPLTFVIHILKCASKIDNEDQYTQKDLFHLDYYDFNTMSEYKSYLNNKSDKMMFTCGKKNHVVLSHSFTPPFRANKVKILWNSQIYFSLKLDFLGCPAYTKSGENGLCGSRESLYRLMDKSYDCMHVKCSLPSFVCSPHNFYFKRFDRKKENTCKSSDVCATKECSHSEICLDFGEEYECHCPEPDGKCESKSDSLMTIDQKEVILLDTVTVYFNVESSVATSNYTLVTEGFSRYSCPLTLMTIQNNITGHTYLCSTFKLQTTAGGAYTVKIQTSNHLSKAVKFMVNFPNSVIYRCFEFVQVIGTRWKKYELVEDITLRLSNENITCETFSITKYVWTFSFFDSADETCISDENFKMKFNLSSDYASVLIHKETLFCGYCKVCVYVTGNSEDTVYKELPITCGYFHIRRLPLVAVIKPDDKKQVVVFSRPFTLDASESKDRSGGNLSELSFDWFCKKVNTSNETCELGPHFEVDANNKIPFTGAVLKIPANATHPMQMYNFSVVVTKPERDNGTTSVLVFIGNKSEPDGEIRCIFNCDRSKVIPIKLMALKIDCKNCGPFKIAHVWTLYRNQSSDSVLEVPYSTWHSKSPTGNNKEVIVLLQETFNTSSSYQFVLTVLYDNNTSRIDYTYSFETNDSPINGSCSVSPKSGKALTTIFTVSCPGYIDSDQPLMYRVYKETKDETDTLLYYGKDNTANIKLSPGPEKIDYRVQLVIFISDSYDTSTKVFLSVQVYEQDKSRLTYLKWLDQSAADLRQEQQGFASSAQLIAEMLQSVETKYAPWEVRKLKEKINKNLLSMVNNSKVTDKHMLYQVSYLAERVFSMEEDISPSMEELALSVSRNLENALMKEMKSDSYTTRIIAAKQCNALAILIEKQMQVIKDRDLNKIETKTKPLLGVMGHISSHVLSSTPMLEGTVNVQSHQVSFSVQKAKPDVNELAITANPDNPNNPGGAFFAPNGMMGTVNEYIDLQMLIMKKNPFKWSETAKKVNLPMMNISVKNDGKTVKPTSLPVAADVFIAMNLSEVMESDKVYGLNVSYDHDSLKVIESSILRLTIPAVKGKKQVLKMITTDSSLKLEVVLGANKTNVSLNNFELHGFTWPIDDDALLTYKNHRQDPYLLFLPEEILGENQTNFILVLRIKAGQIVVADLDSLNTLVANVAIQTFTVQCSYWNEIHQDWRQDGCMVSPFTSRTTLHCWSRHLSVFSGGIFVAPNFVDPIADARLFLTFFNNPVVVTLVVGVWLLYIMLLIWARRSDKQELRQTGMTVLADNDDAARYVYLICVVTGWWFHAGTTARVFIYLCGEKGTSSAHALTDRFKELFTSGSENWFILKMSNSLENIKSVVVWHDNRGENPSWYLKEIVVKDVQTGEVWHCLCDKWLSITKGSGIVKDIVAVEETTHAKKRLYHFKQTSSREFRSEHIWISVFTKPPNSNFTRVQRLTCAFAILMATMLTNIMFHGIPVDDPEYQLDYGEFSFSLVDIVIGIESSLIVFPLNLLIILMFEHTKPKPDVIKADEIEESIGLKIKNSFRLPWYFIYIEYFLTLAQCFIASYFVMLYGLKYGRTKSISWLISFLSSFCQSTFVIEPVKIFALALILTLVLKYNVTYD